MQAGRVVSIGVSERDGHQIVPLEGNNLFGQLFGNYKVIGNLPWKTRIPKRREGLRRCLLAHNLEYFRRRNKAGARKSLENCTGAEEMVSVAVRGVDRGQFLTARRDPIHQSLRLLDGDERVDEDRVPLAVNEG